MSTKALDYYTAPRDVDQERLSMYALWEGGGAYNDSITPSTYCAHYRSHLILKLRSLTDDGGKIVSLGSGNAFVEAALGRNNREILAIDANDEATELALRKGVAAKTADFFDLEASDFAGARVIYADGFLGHIYNSDTGLSRLFQKLDSLEIPSRTYFLVSNDAPNDGTPCQEHPSVEHFWFLSRDFITNVSKATDWEVLESYYFPYERPVSGLRNRTIALLQHK